MNFNFLRKKLNPSSLDKTPSATKALQWVKTHRLPNAGIMVSDKIRDSYPEVTGYFIPTLYRWGEKALARELVQWEISVQRPDGAFSATDNVPYTFDTGQVIRGFVAAFADYPAVEAPLRKACDWILTQVQQDGKLTTPSTAMWGNIADDRIHLYVLPELITAGQLLNEPKYAAAAQKVLNYYKTQAVLTEFDTLSHFFAYRIEALCDLNETELATKAMQQVAKLQRSDGSVPAYKKAKWVCTPGLAQFALIWYKLGMSEPANRAMAYLEKNQQSNGGFLGSYGRGADYFAQEEISWAVKYFLDAYQYRVQADFNNEASDFSDSIDEADGRMQEVVNFFGDVTGKKVLDMGCGKGRYLRFLKITYPKAQLYGVDLSEEMLKSCPKTAITTVGSMLNINYPDSFFDCVLSVEALEHAINVEAAVKEMVRVLKPNGKILIIDKNVGKLGALDVKPWETWFSPEKLIDLLKSFGVVSVCKEVSYDKLLQPDGLFVAWEGVKTVPASLGVS